MLLWSKVFVLTSGAISDADISIFHYYRHKLLLKCYNVATTHWIPFPQPPFLQMRVLEWCTGDGHSLMVEELIIKETFL